MSEYVKRLRRNGMHDVADYVERLEKLYKDTLAELDQVKRERDAAVNDLHCVVESLERCEVCKKRLQGS